MSRAQALVVQVRRTFAFSNGTRAWRRRLVLGLLAAAAGLAFGLADMLSRAESLVLVGILSAALAVLWARGWFTLVGPTFLYDLVRTTRRSRFTLYRVYLYFVLVMLALFYAIWYVQRRDLVLTRDVVAFGQAFFYTFMSLQILGVVLLTPGYVADVLTDEKERRTLEYLMATDLDSREIILSKLAGRLANLLLMLLTGLPIASAVEWMGGVPPELVVIGFAIAGITAISVAAVSLLNSVYAWKTRSAVVLTYLLLAMYLLPSTFSAALPAWLMAVSWRVGGITFTTADVLDGFNAGNPLLQLIRLVEEVRGGGSMANSLILPLERYAIFHGLLAGGCVTWAVLRLRAVFLRQADGQVVRAKRRLSRVLRPSVGSRAMLWKEIYAEGRLRFGRVGKLVLFGMVVGSFVALVPFFQILAPTGAPGLAPYLVSFWSMAVGGAVACLLMLAVAVHAAYSISGERDRATFDGLLTTPLTSSEILFGKLVGSVLSVRWGWLWLGVIWGLGVGYGILHAAVLPLWVLAWLICAAVLALIGLWFSMVSRTGARAMMYTLLVAFVWAIAPLVPFHYFFLKQAYDLPLVQRLYTFQLALSPLPTLGYLLPFWRADTKQPGPSGPTSDPWHKNLWDLRAALLAMLIWALAGLLLWALTSYRFRKQTGRRAYSAERPLRLDDGK